MVLERLLAGNVFENKQKRFRNMVTPDPLDLSVKFRYHLDELWTYKMVEALGRAVSCLSWCMSNPDILAIGYGVYDFVTFKDRKTGFVCLWSIKVFTNKDVK